MSVRAAWRLESLGFHEVRYYEGGKQEWFAYGLPKEGERASVPLAGGLAARGVPSCGLDRSVREAAEVMRAAGWDTCVVQNDIGIVLGRLRLDDTEAAAERDPDLSVEEVMECGPSTFRPSVPVEEMRDYMRRHHTDSALITTPDGRMFGLLRLIDAERAIAEALPDETTKDGPGAHYPTGG